MAAAAVLRAYTPRYAELLADVTHARQQAASARPFCLPPYLLAADEVAMVERVVGALYDLRESVSR